MSASSSTTNTAPHSSVIPRPSLACARNTSLPDICGHRLIATILCGQGASCRRLLQQPVAKCPTIDDEPAALSSASSDSSHFSARNETALLLRLPREKRKGTHDLRSFGHRSSTSRPSHARHRERGSRSARSRPWSCPGEHQPTDASSPPPSGADCHWDGRRPHPSGCCALALVVQ